MKQEHFRIIIFFVIKSKDFEVCVASDGFMMQLDLDLDTVMDIGNSLSVLYVIMMKE